MPSTVTIEEITGQKRRLELRGAAIPKHGATFPSRLRLTTRYPPGASQAVQHVLGPEHGAPEWDGYWSTPALASLPSLFRDGGADQPVTRAATLWTIVESFMLAGADLRVTWAQDDASDSFVIVREGRIEEFEPKPRTKDDVDWSITWAWTGRGERTLRASPTKRDAQLAAHKKVEAELAKLKAELIAQSWLTSNADVIGSASDFSLGDLEALVGNVRDFAGSIADAIQRMGTRIRDLGDLIASVESLPADLAQQLLDATASIMSDVASFKDAVTRRGPESYARLDQSASAKSIYQAAKYISDVSTSIDAVVAACAAARVALLERSGSLPGTPGSAGSNNQDGVQFVIARQGDTFAGIARKKLGDPTLGDGLAKASGYPWGTPAPSIGDLVVVPPAERARQLLPGGG